MSPSMTPALADADHQLDLGYPASPLAFESPKRTGFVLAGDRTPDAPIRCAAGQDMRLLDLFKGPHWTALVMMAAVPTGMSRPNLRLHAIGQHSEVADSGGHVRTAYGVEKGDIFLVRPDGYIGAIAPDEQRHTLTPYMTAVGLLAA